uniref:C2H2-type domain-containing protein n=1 Tax=Anopheles epiroticus TaxID=199890 RepID=A0A182P734_9DIPT
MSPEVGPTYQLSDGTCRLCLEHQDELMPLDCSLSDQELSNVIDGFLKIDNACRQCVMQIRLIEKFRAEFEEKNRIFDVLWTQYKRIHMQADGTGISKLKQAQVEEHNVASGYMTHEMVVEKTEVEIMPPDMLLKVDGDSEQCDIVIKQEHQGEEDHVVEELVYEEFTLGETDLEESEIIVEEKESIDGTNENEMVEEHIEEQEDPENATEAETDDQIEQQLYEITCIEDGEQQHDDGCYDETLHRCYICMETLESDGMLHEHLTTVHYKLLPFHCDKCLRYFRTIHEVNEHLISHEYPFVCLYCPRKYNCEPLLMEHNKECNSYRCPYCPAEFEVSSHLKAHKRQHTAQLRLKNKCKSCGRTFTQACNLQRHLRSGNCNGAKERGPKRKYNRRETQAPESVPPAPNQGHRNTKNMWKYLLYCQVCDRKFLTNSHLARHFERDHSELHFPLFPCDVCTKKFTSFEKSVMHRANHRRSKTKPKEEKKEKETVCKICGKEFRVDHQLLRHLTEEHSLSLELFECDQCPRKFSTDICFIQLVAMTIVDHGESLPA